MSMWVFLSLAVPASEETQAFLRMSCLCAAVDRNQSESHRVAFLPFKIIQEAPVKITFYRETIADAGSDAVKCGIDKSDAPGVIGIPFSVTYRSP